MEINSSWAKLAAYTLSDRDTVQKKSHIKVMALQYIVMIKSTKETEIREYSKMKCCKEYAYWEDNI